MCIHSWYPIKCFLICACITINLTQKLGRRSESWGEAGCEDRAGDGEDARPSCEVSSSVTPQPPRPQHPQQSQEVRTAWVSLDLGNIQHKQTPMGLKSLVINVANNFGEKLRNSASISLTLFHWFKGRIVTLMCNRWNTWKNLEN